MNVVLLIVGIALCVIGAVLPGGLSLRNFGIAIGGSVNQKNEIGAITEGEKKSKRDWIGLAVQIIGLIAAVVGLLRGLMGNT